MNRDYISDGAAQARPRVAILLGAPFTDQNVERLGLLSLAQHFDVFVVDCARLIGRNPDAIAAQRATWPHYLTADTPDALRLALQSYGVGWAIDNIGLDVETAWLGELVQSLGIGLISVQSGLLPQSTLFNRLHSFLVLPGAKDAAALEAPSHDQPPVPGAAAAVDRLLAYGGKIFGRLALAWRRRQQVPVPDLVLLAGDDALRQGNSGRAPARIWIGSEDFYKFREVEAALAAQGLVNPRPPFVLFVDVCLPHASDWKFLGIKPPISASEYYPRLRGLFDTVERCLGMPVVVAGHPNSRGVSDYGTLIGGRELVFGQTAALVMQSSLVLTHASTATSFIAMANKPSVFVSSRAMDLTYYGGRVRAMAQAMRSPLVMLEDAAVLAHSALPSRADVTACHRYVARYLRSDRSPEVQPWAALIDYIARHPSGPIHR